MYVCMYVYIYRYYTSLSLSLYIYIFMSHVRVFKHSVLPNLFICVSAE